MIVERIERQPNGHLVVVIQYTGSFELPSGFKRTVTDSSELVLEPRSGSFLIRSGM